VRPVIDGPIYDCRKVHVAASGDNVLDRSDLDLTNPMK
jgi:hypothetical protein